MSTTATAPRKDTEADLFTPAQRARACALRSANAIITTRGPFGGGAPPNIIELVGLAEYIIDGTKPLDDYRNDDEASDGPE